MLRRYSASQRFRRSVVDTLKLSEGYLLMAAVMLAATFILLLLGASPPTETHKSVVITIPKRASRQAVATILRGRELIRSRTAFNIITHVGYEGRGFMPGTYTMCTDMSLFRVLDKVISGDVAQTSITIPEGFTLAQIAERLGHKEITDSSTFLQLAENNAKEFGVNSPTGSLEGYLFPETYTFGLGLSARQVIQTMVDTFDSRIVKPNRSKLSDPDELHKMVTIASLVEREARVGQDRPLIASVITNRLRTNMRLQIDATVLYAMKLHKSRVLYRDLDTESAYNTYRNRGLPPGPIANPGLASIEAALNPAATDYLYYVAQPDGTHKFARTFHEHIANRPGR